MRSLPMLAALCGCTQVFGLDDPAPLAPDAKANTGRFYEIEYRNTQAGTPSVNERGFASVTGAELTDDGTRIDLAIDDGGYFAYAPHQSPYHLTFDTPVRTDVISSTSSVAVGSRTTGRREATLATSGTRLTVAFNGASTSGLAFVQTTGVWGASIASSGTPQQFTIDWGGKYLVDATANDRTYVTLLADAGGYFKIVQACTLDLTMQQGVPVAVSCAAGPVVQDHCLRFTADTGKDLDRMMSALAPLAYPATTSGWQLLAQPGDIGSPALVLAFSAFNTPVQYDVTTPYSNIFPGHNTALGLTASLTRDVTVNNRSYTLLATTQRYVAPGADCNTPAQFAEEVAFPTAPTIDNISLGPDNVAISLDRTRPARLSWQAAASGRADAYEVTLIDLEIGVAKAVITTPLTDISIDPSLFERDHHYIVRVEVAAGLPYASFGDFTTTGFPGAPYGLTIRDSGVFSIAN